MVQPVELREVPMEVDKSTRLQELHWKGRSTEYSVYITGRIAGKESKRK